MTTFCKPVVDTAVNLVIQNIKASRSQSDHYDEDQEYRHDTAEKIDEEIRDILVAAEAIQKSIKDRLAKCHRRRNQVVSPLLQLPDEMISEILFQYIQAEPIENRYRYHGVISTVCYRLYQIYQDCPRLWSRILDPPEKYLQNPCSWTARMLEKSKNAPLDIILSSYPFSGLSTLLHAIDMVTPHSHRWRSFDCTYTVNPYPRFSIIYQSPQEASSMDSLADLRAPLLRKLVIKNHAIQSPSKQINLLGGSAPSLQHLDIEPIFISWDSPLLSGLTFLRIKASDGTRPPTADQFQRVLRSCPALEELHLAGKHPDGIAADLAARFSSDIPLPKLRSLLLKNLHPATTGSLLSSIRANPQSLTIVFPGQRWEDFFHTGILEPPSHHLLSKFTSSLDTVGFEEYSFDGYGQHGVFMTHVDSNTGGDSTLDTSKCIFSGPKSCALIYCRMVTPSARRTIRSLVINTNYPAQYEEDFCPRLLLEELPELRELTLGGKCTLPWAAIGPLANPVQMDTGMEKQWLCPHLDTLVFEGISVNIEVLWLFIQSRYCRIDQVQKPDKLVNLRVMNVPTTFDNKAIFLKFASNLVDVVGKDGFVWGNRKLDASGVWIPV
ncbi:hypothetical protein FRC03_001801 [Tulasnella sp. 419]|nr:hypothetical protein FRC02_002047 [Tulasnella sp. 418]KAG8945150.1 hypothetical protein FRC03_001801 [Tulasnella sp. 419]